MWLKDHTIEYIQVKLAVACLHSVGSDYLIPSSVHLLNYCEIILVDCKYFMQ